MLDGHPPCKDRRRHVCSQPSGRTCIEDGCDEPAGTLWGPLWCPDHDSWRMQRISQSLEQISRDLEEQR